MNNLQIFINNEEVLCNNKLSIKEEILNTSSTILNNCYPKSWENNKDYVNNYYYPKDYSKCKILQNNELLFAGVIKNTGNISLNPRYPHYCDLQVLSYKTFLSEGDTFDFVINNKTIEEAIELIINKVAGYGFVKGNINISQADEIIGAYSTLNKTAYDCFQYFAEISNSKWITRIIDEDTIAIDYFDPELMEQGNSIVYNNNWWKQNDLIDLTFTYSTNDYRNKQIITSDEIIADINYNESIYANGYSTEYYVSSNIAEIISIKINDVEATFATNIEKDMGVYADIYYTKGDSKLETNEILAAGSNIIILYTPLVKGRQVIYNSNEVSRINNQTGTTGIISRYENRNDALSSNELTYIANSYIKFKGQAEVTLKVQTKNNNLWEIGNVVEMIDCPLEELNVNYMVKSKTTDYYFANNDVFYTFELTSTYNSETAINYFDNQRSKMQGNLGEGDFIDRNIDIENESNIIFDNLRINSETLETNNILNCGLDSPFID